MTKVQRELLNYLSDGEFHSGEALGTALGMSRAAIWKQVQNLVALGHCVDSERGRGYTLRCPVEFLNAEMIMDLMATASRLNEGGHGVSLLECLDTIPSTNDYLLDLAVRQNVPSGTVCFAEQQTAGRGRRGRVWKSPYGQNIMMSVLWRFDQGVGAFEGLSLATGVVMAESLASFGVGGLELKWPNDLFWRGKKLGGVLIEVGGDASGECFVVVGVGINRALSVRESASIDQPWVDLSQMGYVVGRNRLAADLSLRLTRMLSTYHEDGFARYKSSWEELNAYKGRVVALHSASSVVEGLMVGVSRNGGIILQMGDRRQIFLGGEISLGVVSDS